MSRAPRYEPGIARLDSICDGHEFLSADQVAALTGLTAAAVRQAVARGHLCPGKIANQLVFTRRDVKRWRKQDAELVITRELTKGKHPLDVYLEADGRYPLELVNEVMIKWAKVTGRWVIEGPRGSYARWLQRLGLELVDQRMLRRLVELLLADAYVQRLVVAKLPAFRPSRELRDELPSLGLAEVTDASAPAPTSTD